MTDASTLTNSSDPTKSPLDILEEILGKSGAGVSDADRAEADQTVAAQKEDTQQLAAQQQYEVVLQEQQAKDNAAIQEKTQELASIIQTPAYQARVQQEATEHQQQELKDEELDGYEVNQIAHTTIEVTEEA